MSKKSQLTHNPETGELRTPEAPQTGSDPSPATPNGDNPAGSPAVTAPQKVVEPKDKKFSRLAKKRIPAALKRINKEDAFKPAPGVAKLPKGSRAAAAQVIAFARDAGLVKVVTKIAKAA